MSKNATRLVACERCGAGLNRQVSHIRKCQREGRPTHCQKCSVLRTTVKKPELPRLPDVWWAWMAGFFDGEGSCSKGSKTYWRIQIAQKGKRPLLEIAERLGFGSVSIQQASGCWVWEIGNCYAVVWCLDNMQPHLRVKDDKLGKVIASLQDNRLPGDKILKFIKREVQND